MPLSVLIAPDKFKGTLTASDAAKAIARGWSKARPGDRLDVLPMTDGGDGFGEIVGRTIGARRIYSNVVDAAHQPIRAPWWWDPDTRTAVIESALVIGLAMLPRGKFHPFDLDTFGLGRVLAAAEAKGAKRMIIGIGGSATNDGGFGLARALGWEFLTRTGDSVLKWTDLYLLHQIRRTRPMNPAAVTVAVDVQNKLLGANGCSRVYGPQKGLRPTDFALAEKALRRLATVTKGNLGKDFSVVPGAGAAGGLGFALMAFCNAKPRPGFEIFAGVSQLEKHLRQADLVLTGEGAIDDSTLMGKGVGELALRCRKLNVPCVALAGTVADPRRANRLFALARGLTELTDLDSARADPKIWLERLATETSLEWTRQFGSSARGKQRKLARHGVKRS